MSRPRAAGGPAGATSSSCGSTPGPQQFVLDRPGRVGHGCVLGQEGEQAGVLDGGRGEDGCRAIQALELLGGPARR
jgi:hypothetical protein